MNAFKGCGDTRGRLAVGFEKRCAFHDQEGAQPLAAVEHAMPHRRRQPLRPGDLAGQRPFIEQAAQHRLDGRGPLKKCLFERFVPVFRHGGER